MQCELIKEKGRINKSRRDKALMYNKKWCILLLTNFLHIISAFSTTRQRLVRTTKTDPVGLKEVLYEIQFVKK